MRLNSVITQALGAVCVSLLGATAAAEGLTLRLDYEPYASGAHTIATGEIGPFQWEKSFEKAGEVFDNRCGGEVVDTKGQSYAKVDLKVLGQRWDDGLVMLKVEIDIKQAGEPYDRSVVASDGSSITKIKCPVEKNTTFSTAAALRPGERVVLLERAEAPEHKLIRLAVEIPK